MFSIIGISETWLKDSDHFCGIAGYNFIHDFRNQRSGGGVGLYLKQEFEFKRRPDLYFANDSAESLFVEVERTKEKNLIVGIIYRPPEQNIIDFNAELDRLLFVISKNNKECILLGDWNIDLIKHNCHRQTAEFLDIMYSKLFVPLITRPSRITSHTATLLDNIFVNNPSNYLHSGLLISDISDHQPVFSFLSNEVDGENKQNIHITYREKSTENMNKFRLELEQCEWKDVLQNDCSSAYNNFLNKITVAYNKCFPIKKKRLEIGFRQKPWLTKGLLKSASKRTNFIDDFYAHQVRHGRGNIKTLQ